MAQGEPGDAPAPAGGDRGGESSGTCSAEEDDGEHENKPRVSGLATAQPRSMHLLD